jgi:hypothetical protein
MDCIPDFLIRLWAAQAHNEMYPDGPKQTALLTSADLIQLEQMGGCTPSPSRPAAYQPCIIKEVKSITMHF